MDYPTVCSYFYNASTAYNTHIIEYILTSKEIILIFCLEF